MATTAPTNEEFDAMSFGYLTGADLSGWSPYATLISNYQKNPTKIRQGCDTAYQEVTNMFLTKYNVKAELNAISGARELAFVKFVAITALKNILGNLAGEGTVTEANFLWHDEMLNKIREGVDNFALQPPAGPCYASDARLYPQNFRWLG
jgi:hypothetical protein